jgi:hypothetical protein
MATAVGVMDAPGLAANTDVLVLADADARVLLWIPRDLWCETLRDRVNRAFALGRHRQLAEALAEHGLEIDASIVLDRRVAERALAGARVRVPVEDRIELWYPTDPIRPIEEGKRKIQFEPPGETLEGERIHQWIGARYAVGGPGSDIDRIERQQILVAALLEQGFEFGAVLDDPDQIAISGPALEELRRVDASFVPATFAAGAVSRKIDGKDVLVR